MPHCLLLNLSRCGMVKASTASKMSLLSLRIRPVQKREVIIIRLAHCSRLFKQARECTLNIWGGLGFWRSDAP